MTKDEAKKLHHKMGILSRKDGRLFFNIKDVAEDDGELKMQLPRYGGCAFLRHEGAEILIFRPQTEQVAVVLCVYE